MCASMGDAWQPRFQGSECPEDMPADAAGQAWTGTTVPAARTGDVALANETVASSVTGQLLFMRKDVHRMIWKISGIHERDGYDKRYEQAWRDR